MAGFQTPIVDSEYIIQRFEQKGGWHYVMIREDLKAYKQKFGWIPVHGSIDGHETGPFRLAPYGKGNAMLTLNGTIRKAINKGVGDSIQVLLYAEDALVEAPNEVQEVLEFYPKAQVFFATLSAIEQKLYTDFISEAKTAESKTDRFNKIIDMLEAKKKFSEL